MEIIRLNGTEKRLYDIVAPLVMNPAVIRQNNGYPFKTSDKYVWYIAVENDAVAGFMPLKNSGTGYLIDNYYIRGDNAKTITMLLDRVAADIDDKSRLTATVFKRHVDVFRQNRFLTAVEWKNYDKMQYDCTTHRKKWLED